MKIIKLILQQKWPRNNYDTKYDPQESLVLVSNKEMDQFVLTNSFIAIDMEEPNSPTCLEDKMMETTNKQETIPTITTCLENVMTNSNDGE